MKGLLIKDLRIMLSQKTTLLVIVLLGIFMSTNGGNPAFSLGYMMIVSVTMVANTIYYDYFERGMSFLLTLPISRKLYVMEKYVLALVMEFLVAMVAVLIQVVAIVLGQPADWGTFAGVGVGCMVAALLILAVYIPVNIKCGPEKSRIAMLIVFGSIALITYLVAKVEPVRVLFNKLVVVLGGMSAGQLVALAVGAWVLIMAASIGISMKIMEKKEF